MESKLKTILVDIDYVDNKIQYVLFEIIEGKVKGTILKATTLKELASKFLNEVNIFDLGFFDFNLKKDILNVSFQKPPNDLLVDCYSVTRTRSLNEDEIEEFAKASANIIKDLKKKQKDKKRIFSFA